ncbi:MAG: energy transducer TonB [Cytophagales bacterium]
MAKLIKFVFELVQDKTHLFDNSLYQKRSQTYGSFFLRKNYAKHLNQGALFSFSIFIFSFLFWLIFELNFDHSRNNENIDIIDFESFDITLPPIPAELLKPRLSSAEKIVEENTPKDVKTKNEVPEIVKEVQKKPEEQQTKKSENTKTDTETGGKTVDSTNNVGNSKNGEINSNQKTAIEPIGGINEFVLYVQKNVKYPDEALKYKISGTVYVFFVVNELGKIEDVKFTKKLGYGIEEEIARVMADAPDWKPFVINGVPQKNKVHVPIKLNLP